MIYLNSAIIICLPVFCMTKLKNKISYFALILDVTLLTDIKYNECLLCNKASEVGLILHSNETVRF